MSRSFKLPDLGEGIHEGEVLAVPVEAGQEVKEGDIILEVETDKATQEFPAEASGVLRIKVEEGETVEVGYLNIHKQKQAELVKRAFNI